MTAGRKLVILLAVTVFITAALGLWRWWLDTPPPRPARPPMPKINAFDIYYRAADAVADPLLVRWAARPVPARDPWHKPGAGSAAPALTSATLAEKRAIVAANQSSLAGLRRGFCHPYRNRPNSTPYDPYYHFATLADLLMLQAQVAVADSDPAGAMQSCLDCVRFAEHVVSGGGYFNSQLSEEMEAAARRVTWPVIDKAGRRDLVGAIHRMQQIELKSVAYSGFVRDAKLEMQESLLEDFRSPHWRREWADSMESAGRVGSIAQKCRAYMTGKRKIYADCSRMCEEAIAAARQPYARRLPAPNGSEDPFYSWVFPDFEAGYGINTPSRCFYEYTRAANKLMITAMALRAWKLDHGTYPGSLTELVPSYLAAVPKDPFAMRVRLVYRRKGTGYLLYSLGPDCADDHGKAASPEDLFSYGGRLRDDIVDARGDLVATADLANPDQVPAPVPQPVQGPGSFPHLPD